MNDQTNVAQLPATIPARRPQEVRVVNDPIPVLDTARFEHMQRIANVMAHSNLVPDALCKTKDGDAMVALAPEEILSNCFLVVNQAVRWGMDPFAVAQCVSVVKGKLCYEGKLIAAVLDAKLGVKLEYEISGIGDAMKIVVSAAIDGKPVVDSKGRPKTVEGTVADWKTTHSGSPWSAPGGKPRMLRYRGAREWSRVYESSIMLGVYSPDELEDLADDHRGRRAREIPARTNDDDGPPPPPPLIAQAATLAPSAQPEPAQDAVAMVESGRDDGKPEIWSDFPPEQDGPPNPSAQSSGTAPATSRTTPQAGAVRLTKDQLITSIGKIATFAECDPWADRHGADIEALADGDRREVERAFNSKSGALSRDEQKRE